MATTKKSANTVHKRTVAASTGGTRAFDIIPRSQVKPSANSRPIITTTQPEQLDNTLKTAPAMPAETRAAGSHLTHKPLNLNSSDSDSGSEIAGQLNPGVPLADLLAAKQAAASAPATDAGPMPTPPEDAVQTSKTEEQPVATEPVEIAEAEKPVTVGGEKVIQPPSSNDVAATHNSDAEAPTKNATDPATDSVDQVLKEEAASDKPQSHSQALKDELATLDGDKTDKTKDDERPHHELYGGKPVIVIHNGRGAASVLNVVLWLLVCLAAAVIIVDVLLDMNIITTSINIPHTNWF